MGHHLLPSQGLQREPEWETEQLGLELVPPCRMLVVQAAADLITSQHQALHRLSLRCPSTSQSWGDGSADLTVGFQRRKTECLAPGWHLLRIGHTVVQTQNTEELWAYLSHT